MNTNEYAPEYSKEDVSAMVSKYVQRFEVEDTHTKSKDDPTVVTQSIVRMHSIFVHVRSLLIQSLHLV